MSFKDHLRQQGLRPSTIASYERCLRPFMEWLDGTGPAEIGYTDLLGYVRHCRDKGYKRGRINKLMGVVRRYYAYLKRTGEASDDPAAGLFIRDRGERVPRDLMDEERLEALYRGFDRKGLAGERNKVILGLLIFQGLTTGELGMLEPGHLRLREGRMEVPGTGRSNGRTLKLEAPQMIGMQEYVTRTRERILELTGKRSDKLLVSTGGAHHLRGSLDKLIRKLKEEHTDFTGAKQLRQSRIAIWIKYHDIRRVQYMAGHRYVSSTEHYRSTAMEDLRKDLEQHHPSGG